MNDYTNKDMRNHSFIDKKEDYSNKRIQRVRGEHILEIVEKPDYSYSDLTGSIFLRCNLTGWKLSLSNLTRIQSSENVGHPHLPENWRLLKKSGYLIGPTANLGPIETNGEVIQTSIAGEVLSDLHLNFIIFDQAALADTTFTKSNLIGSSFRNTELSVIDFGSADLRNSNFTNASINYCNFDYADLSGANFQDSKLNLISARHITGKPLNMPSGYVIQNNVIIGPGANIASCNLAKADLSKIDLSLIKSGQVSGEPQLPPAWKLIGGYLFGPKANLSNGIFNGMQINDVNLDGANLQGSSLAESQFKDITGMPVNLPDGYIFANRAILGPYMNLENLNLDSSDLRLADLTGASSGGVRAENALLPPSWKLIGGYFVGPSANLKSACLDGLLIQDVDLSQADLGSASLHGLRSKNIRGSGLILPKSWKLSGGVLLGPGADVAGIDLSQCDFSGLDVKALLGKPKSLPSGWVQAGDMIVGPGSNLEGVNIDGLDFSDANLENLKSGNTSGKAKLPLGWNLVGGYLIGYRANLSDAVLSKLDLRNLVFDGADLSDANLSQSDLRGASMESTDLHSTLLTGAITSIVKGEPSQLPNGVFQINQTLLGEGLVVDGADLSDSDFSSCTLDNLDLSKITLTGATGNNIVGENFALPIDWQVVDGVLLWPTAIVSDHEFSNIGFENLNLQGAKIREISFKSCSFENCNFTGTEFVNVKFINCGLIKVNLYETQLSEVRISNSKLKEVSFEKSRLTNFYIRDSDLISSSFRGSRFINVDFWGITISTDCSLPDGFQIVLGQVIGNTSGTNRLDLYQNIDIGDLDLKEMTFEKYDGIPVRGLPKSLPDNILLIDSFLYSNFRLENIDISGCNLEGKNLKQWVFKNVKSGGIQGKPRLPSGWRIVKGYLIGPTANLANAQLADADLSGLDLRNTSFIGADLSRANLTNCTLNFADFSKANLSGTILPGGSQIVLGQVVGSASGTNRLEIYQNVDLSDLELKHLNFKKYDGIPVRGLPKSLPDNILIIDSFLYSNFRLENTDISGCNLEGKDLSNWVFQNVKSGGIQGNPLLPSGWRLVKGYLIGPQANLDSAQLADADLSGLDLRNTSFIGADLSRANLTNCKLNLANLSKAKLNGAILPK